MIRWSGERTAIVGAILGVVLVWSSTAVGGEEGLTSTEGSIRSMRGEHAVVTFSGPDGVQDLRVQLVDAASALPLGEVDVEVMRFKPPAGRDPSTATAEEARTWAVEFIRATTTEDGRFEIKVLLPGNYSFQVMDEGRETVEWNLRWRERERKEDGGPRPEA